jgi:hypothetical protein
MVRGLYGIALSWLDQFEVSKANEIVSYDTAGAANVV